MLQGFKSSTVAAAFMTDWPNKLNTKGNIYIYWLIRPFETKGEHITYITDRTINVYKKDSETVSLGNQNLK